MKHKLVFKNFDVCIKYLKYFIFECTLTSCCVPFSDSHKIYYIIIKKTNIFKIHVSSQIAVFSNRVLQQSTSTLLPDPMLL